MGSKFQKPESKRYKAKRLTSDSIKTEMDPPGLVLDYTTGSKPCAVDRLKEGRCASQLVFRKGRPMLQLCNGYKEPGDLLPVTDALDAQEKAERHCAVKYGGMSEFVQPGQRQQRVNPAWLAAGVAMGVMAAVLLKQRAST